jgi:hypothetical protein
MPETLSSAHDIIQAAKAAQDKFGNRPMWRGQDRFDDWPLVPKVYRSEEAARWEHSMVAEFRFQAKTRYAHGPSDGDRAGWLFLMQHYGLPTRLLDWTDAVLCAAYFAVRERTPQDGLLCALDPMVLNGQQGRGMKILTPLSEPARLLIEAIFEEPHPATRRARILAIGADQIDLRMTVQQSAFTIHGNPTPLEDLDKSDSFLVKYRIPQADKAYIADELAMLGINEASLFPDLDALARHISWHYTTP